MMADSTVQETGGQVEKGTRIRTVCDKNILRSSSSSSFNHKIYFDSFAIDFNWSASTHKCIVSIVGFLSSSVTPVQLQQHFASYSVDFDLRVVDSEKEYVKDHFLFNNETEYQNLDTSSFYNKTVDFEIKFNRIDGLCVPPLRDYSISTDVSDITLVVEEQRFQLNRGFLASLSSYFERLFFGNFTEKSKDEIVLKDISADAFTDLLDVLHQELHPINNKEKLFAVLKLADQWDVPSVIAKVQTSFKLYPHMLRLNVGEKLWMFDRFHMTVFLHQSLVGWQKSDSRYMTEEMFSELSEATKFSMFKKFA